ncbi:MAG: outer membrane biosynthesis protein TonB [Polyangiales bacterium]|jgi:outer membrane biosynthesis protein TonB
MIRRVVRRHHNEIRHCYERSLQAHPELDGRVMTRFIVGPEGSVLSSSVVESSLQHAETELCVTRVLLRLTFPQTDGVIVRVNYPFEFGAVGP